MRGGYLHNHVLLDPIEAALRQRGARTWREKATSPGRRTGYVDLLVELGDRRIAIEAECSSKRIAGDLAKSAEVDATELWMVVPTVSVAASVRRRLKETSVAALGAEVFVLTLGQALQRVTDCFPLIAGPNVPGKTNSNSKGAPPWKSNGAT